MVKNDGIGIGNTNTYLKQRFGQSYGIEITSRIMESTKVIIKLPVQKVRKTYESCDYH